MTRSCWMILMPVRSSIRGFSGTASGGAEGCCGLFLTSRRVTTCCDSKLIDCILQLCSQTLQSIVFNHSVPVDPHGDERRQRLGKLDFSERRRRHEEKVWEIPDGQETSPIVVELLNRRWLRKGDREIICLGFRIRELHSGIGEQTVSVEAGIGPPFEGSLFWIPRHRRCRGFALDGIHAQCSQRIAGSPRPAGRDTIGCQHCAHAASLLKTQSRVRPQPATVSSGSGCAHVGEATSPVHMRDLPIPPCECEHRGVPRWCVERTLFDGADFVASMKDGENRRAWSSL